MPPLSTRYLWCYSLVLVILMVALLVLREDNWLSWKPTVPMPVQQPSDLKTSKGHAGIRYLEETFHAKGPQPAQQKWRRSRLNKKQMNMINRPKPLWGLKQFLQLTENVEQSINATSNNITSTPDWSTTTLISYQRQQSTPSALSTDTTTLQNDDEAEEETMRRTTPTSTAQPKPLNVLKSDAGKLHQETDQSSQSQGERQRWKILHSQASESSSTTTRVYDDSVTVSASAEDPAWSKGQQQDQYTNATTHHWKKRDVSKESERAEAVVKDNVVKATHANVSGEAKEMSVSDPNAEIDSLKESSFEGRLNSSASRSQSNDTYASIRNGVSARNFSNDSSKLILWYQPTRFLPSMPFPVPLSSCPDARCYVTTNKNFFQDSAALIFAARIANNVPPPARLPEQVWVLHNHERPLSLRGNEHWISKKPFRGFFNWTMGYRTDSDIWQPYGLVAPRKSPLVPRNYSAILAAKTGSVAWLVSHCSTSGRRKDYVQELQRYVSVDIFGFCGNRTCSRQRDDECTATIEKKYRFYLAFENRLCHDYVTEKFFRYFGSSLVVVVRGGANYSRFAPHRSYIDAADFRSARELGAYLNFLSRDNDAYLRYLRAAENWESRYEAYPIVGKNGKVKYATYHYLQSPMCELCNRLWRLQDYRHAYDNVMQWIEKPTCQRVSDVPPVSNDN